MSDAIDKVIRCIQDVFANSNKPAPPLSVSTRMDASLGLVSLEFAELIVRLEEEFGADPFNAEEALSFATVGELAAIYERTVRS